MRKKTAAHKEKAAISTPSRLQHLAGATGILLAAQILGAVLQLFSLRTVQDALSKSANGEFFWVQQVSMFVYFIFVEIGMNAVATRLVVVAHEADNRRERIITSFFKLRFLLFCAATLLLLGYTALFVPMAVQQMFVYALSSLFSARSLMLRSVLELQHRAQNFQLLPAFTTVLDTVLFAAFVAADRASLTPLRVMFWLFCSSLPGFLVMLLARQQWKMLWNIPFEWAIARELVREALPIFSTALLLQIQDKADTFMLDFFYGKEAVGIYGASVRVAAQSATLLMILPTVIAPVASALQTSNLAQCKRYVLEGFSLTILVATLIASGITVLIPFVIFMTAGAKYTHNVLEFTLSAWSIPLSMIVAYTLALGIALGEQRKLLGMFWGLCITSLLCNLAITPHWGTSGALACKILANAMGAILGIRVLHRFMGEKAFGQALTRLSVVFCVMLSLSLLMQYCTERASFLLSLPRAFHVFLLGISISAAFVVVCFMLGILSKERIHFLRSLLQKNA